MKEIGDLLKKRLGNKGLKFSSNDDAQSISLTHAETYVFHYLEIPVSNCHAVLLFVSNFK